MALACKGWQVLDRDRNTSFGSRIESSKMKSYETTITFLPHILNILNTSYEAVTDKQSILLKLFIPPRLSDIRYDPDRK